MLGRFQQDPAEADVLFTLLTPEKSARDLERIDANVWLPLNHAIDLLVGMSALVVLSPLIAAVAVCEGGF